MTRLAIDIGGTFTDLVLFDEKSGKLTAFKSLSTPKDPSNGVLSTIKLSKINISDVISKGARPKYYFLSILVIDMSSFYQF